MEIGAWLGMLEMERYEQAFRENDIDLDLLRDLDGEDLKELGVVSLGHRKRLLTAISALAEISTTDSRVPDTAPAQVVSKAVGAAASLPAAERRQLTVMFVDLVGSTALSASLDPEDMHEVIRSYQNTVAGEIGRLEGHVAKFMGDGVLAYFG